MRVFILSSTHSFETPKFVLSPNKVNPVGSAYRMPLLDHSCGTFTTTELTSDDGESLRLSGFQKETCERLFRCRALSTNHTPAIAFVPNDVKSYALSTDPLQVPPSYTQLPLSST